MVEKRTRRRGFLASREGLEKLEARRGEKRYTHESLAEVAGLNADDQVKRLFNPHWGLGIEKNAIEKIAKVLDLNPKDFIDDWLPTKNLPNSQTKVDINLLNWWEICSSMWQYQQKQQQIRRKATEMGFEVKVYVPLGLVERKQQQRRSGIINTEQIHQLDPEVITQIYKHQEFLDDIIGQQPTDQDQHIVIIGEPGAGKTTLLDRIATYIKDKNQDLFICISLANLQGRSIKTYILNEWLPKAIALSYPELDPDSLEKTFQHRLNQGGVWLLLDGADEGKLSLAEIQTEISNFVKIRVVLTCRSNVWDIYVNNPLTRFKTYKTQEFKPEQIDQFIQGWFEQAQDEIRGKELQAKLKEPQRDRIRQLVTNPLRLALLCQIFYKDKNAELPETKAGLYEQFVRYFYEWKPAITGIDWGTQPQLQDELHQGLGKLAIAGLDSNYRYRLPLSLITTEMDDRLFKLALDLGWLTLVDREEKTDDVVYAFYHPTFQEYFAALAIDDWDFFLPRDHVDRPVTGKSYRIFEDQWRDPILFWIANKHIKKDDKENFLQALATFEDNCENLYAYRCVFLAAILTAEFKDCSIADLIIKQIVFWRLRYYYKEEELVFIKITDRILQNILLETYREKTISHLINFLELTNDPLIHLLGLWSLGKIDYGNQSVIIKLINILTSSQNQYLKYDAAYILGEIASKNELAIAILSEIIEKDFSDEYMRGKAAWSLGKISPGNNLAIITLLDIMSTTKDQYLAITTTKCLIEIGYNNNGAIIGLSKIVKTRQNQYKKAIFAWALGKIDHGNRLAISSLIKIIANNNSKAQCLEFSVFILDITYRNKFALNQLFKILKKINSISIKGKVTNYLLKLTDKNQNTINELIQLLKTTKDQKTVINLISILGCIAIGSQLAISTLIKIILSSYDYSIRAMAVDSLTNILENRQQYIDVVKAFRPYIKNKTYNNNYEILRNYFEILWNCAQHISYPEFYQAWHESETTKEQLETKYNDIGKLLNQLQPTDQVYPILIDGKYSLENLTDESAIAQELCNQIYEAIFPDDDIPTVKNAPELKRLFPKFKIQLNILTLVFIIYNIEPYPELINVCRQLLGKFHIAFITDQQIEPDLRGFPMQDNLVDILQNWLTEISYKETL